MDLAAAFAVFAGAMSLTLSRGYSMCWGMIVGYLAFISVGLRRGFSLKNLLCMSWSGSKNALIVIRVLLIIGVLTGTWRASGTFALLVAWGLKLISPHIFILAAYLLSAALSYAIGTSFGVAGTLGVALMTLARTSGANELLTAGAILSGIYFGDRCSPASSCALLVASVTKTDHYSNIHLMLRTCFLAVLCSVALYGWLSLRNPATGVGSTMADELAVAFNLDPWVVLPAVLMLVLPLFKVRPYGAFITSILCALFCAFFFQKMTLPEIISCAILGFREEAGSVRSLFNGGGLVSMLSMCAILFISGSFSGIFEGTKMLDSLQAKLRNLIRQRSPFPVLALTGLCMNGLFCNQTIGILMTGQMLARPYDDAGLSRREMAQDIANSTAVTAGIVPWNIACSVPLTMMGVSAAAVPYAFFLYLLPLSYGFTRKIWFKNSEE